MHKGVIAGLCFIGLAGCGGEATGQDTTPPSAIASDVAAIEPSTEAEPLRVAQADATEVRDPMANFDPGHGIKNTKPWFGDLNAMVERRAIRVLTVYGPGRYYLDDGPKGITAEYASRLEKVVNDAFDTGHLKARVYVIPVARDQLFPALNAGRGDIIIAGTTITEARKANVDFTIPASKPLSEIVVTGPTAPPIKTLSDFSGKTVHVRQSSSYANSVKRLSRDLEAKGLEPIEVQYISELLEDEDLIEMVNSGLLPWAVVDDYKPTMWEGVFDNIVVRNDLVLRKGARLGWAMRKDSPELKKFLNDFLKTSREGTLFGNIIRNRYVRDFDWTSTATGDEELERYRKLANYFRRHGTAYGIDPTLLAAQGYQESKLDQSARSHVGAIGVMQLLPSTAADKNVNIPNIEQVDPNIEAGAKYMSFLKKRYFSDDDIADLNGSLLALAAYNAGPSKVRRLRREAAERGYDPNVWFDNVEVIAAEQIGRETVQYVSNIFKYYLTYNMLNHQSALREAAREAVGAGDP